jgi:predicted nucleic acid-binding protein
MTGRSILLVDTNILLRYFNPAHPDCALTRRAVASVVNRVGVACVVPQVIYEFWVVATRSKEKNGFNRLITEVEQDVGFILQTFRFLADNERVFSEWKSLVATHAVIGKTAHDARLAAAADVHGVRHLLTFNTPDFRRFDRLTLHDPREVATADPLL